MRPDIIRQAPIYFELKKHPDLFEVHLLHTGQHYDYNLSQVFFEQFNLPEPSFKIESGSGSPAFQISTVMRVCESIFKEQRPDLVITCGDSNSALGTALATAKLNLKLAHMEAGLRSNDRSESEEINRILIDRITAMMFTSCDEANLNLIKQAVDVEQVFLVGTTAIDTLRHFQPRAKKSDILDKLNLEGQKYLLTTIHRSMNIEDDRRLRKIIKLISSAAERTTVVFPIHPHTRRRLEEINESHAVLNNRNIRLCDPLGYFEFLQIEQNAVLVLTDSRGVQDESTYLGIPCLTLLPATVRNATISDGTNRLVDLDQDKIMRQIEYHLEGGTVVIKKPAFWEGQAAERAVRILSEQLFENGKTESKQKAMNTTGKVKMLTNR